MGDGSGMGEESGMGDGYDVSMDDAEEALLSPEVRSPPPPNSADMPPPLEGRDMLAATSLTSFILLFHVCV